MADTADKAAEAEIAVAQPEPEVLKGKEDAAAAAATNKDDESKPAEKNGEANGDAAAKVDEKNDQTDKTTSEPTALEAKIIRQIEYYFGDINIVRDKFLSEQIKNNTDGWVPLSVLLTFKRLAALSTDPVAIVNALVKSDEGLLEISEDKQSIRRHPERPLPEQNDERMKELQSRTAYAKGFPLDAELSDIIEFFNGYEKVVNVIMRKYLDKQDKKYKFKGSVFVTFKNQEQAKAFVEQEKVSYKERDLLRKFQLAYMDEKAQENKANKEKRAEKKAAAAAATQKAFELPKGAVLAFEGADEAVTREMLRKGVEDLELPFEVAYVDFSKGNSSGNIRLNEEGAAAKLMEKLEENKLKLEKDLSIVVRLLTEEEEETYLNKAKESMQNRRTTGGQNRKRHNNNFHKHAKKQRRN